jgi:hypothetical protein
MTRQENPSFLQNKLFPNIFFFFLLNCQGALVLRERGYRQGILAKAPLVLGREMAMETPVAHAAGRRASLYV